MNWPWSELGLPGPAPLTEVRRAYARRLQTVRPEEDPEGFQRLHGAFLLASRLARRLENPPVRPGDEGENGGGREAAPYPEKAADGADSADDDRTDRADDDRDGPGDDDREDYREDYEEDPGDDYRDDCGDDYGDDYREDYEDDYRADYEEDPDFPEDGAEGGFGRRAADWDFERLFAEGAAEERGARFLRAQRLRRENRRRYAHWTLGCSTDPARAGQTWMAVSGALQTAELLESMEADVPAWRRFLESGEFAAVRSEPDFVLGLEDLLKEHPQPRPVRLAIARAFGIESGRPRPELRPLRRLLLPEREKRRGDAVFRGVVTAAAVYLLLSLFWQSGPEKQTPDSAALLEQRLETLSGETGQALETRSIGGRKTFLFRLPLRGAEGMIARTGACLAAAAEEEWYRERPPECDVYLCWNDWCFYRCALPGESFDTGEALAYYRDALGAEMCCVLAEESGAAEADLGPDYLLTPRGQVVFEEADNAVLFWASGVSAPAETEGETAPADGTGAETGDPPAEDAAVHYLLSGDGTELFCVPRERFTEALTLAELYALPGERRGGLTVRDFCGGRA